MKQTWQPWDEKSHHGLKIESELIGGRKNPLKVNGQCSSRGKKLTGVGVGGGAAPEGDESGPPNTVSKSRNGGRGITG